MTRSPSPEGLTRSVPARLRPIRQGPPRAAVVPAENRNLVYARHRAVRRTRLLGDTLTADVSHRVLLQGHRGIAPLLRAVVNQPVFADVEIARAGSATPLVRSPLRDVVLERVDAGEAALFKRLHLVIHRALFGVQGLQLPAAVVNDPDRRAEAELHGAPADRQRILRILHPAANH